MKYLLFTILLLTLTFTAKAQEVTPTPEAKVEILASTADKCADAFTERKALRNEVEVLKTEREELKKEIQNLQIDLAKLAGEKNGADTMIIRLSAMVDLLLKSTKPKQNGLINIHF